MARSVLIFDGACPLCVRWARAFQQATGDQVEYVASDEAAVRFPQVPRERTQRSIVLVGANVLEGAQAAFAALEAGGRGGAMRLYRRSPLFAAVAERAYRVVADHRRLFGALDRAVLGAPERAEVRSRLLAALARR